MNRLILCSGIVRREGWKTLDCNAKHGADFLATIPPLPAEVKAIQWDEVEWVHGITSFYPWDGKAVLAELSQCIREGGRLVLEQPDFRKAVERPEWVFGDPSYREPLIMNRWGYTPESLTEVLLASGFRLVKIFPAQFHKPERDFRLEAFR